MCFIRGLSRVWALYYNDFSELKHGFSSRFFAILDSSVLGAKHGQSSDGIAKLVTDYRCEPETETWWFWGDGVKRKRRTLCGVWEIEYRVRTRFGIDQVVHGEAF